MSAEGLRPAPKEDWVALAAPLIASFGLWLIVRPYLGFAGDGRLYLGRALAAADPGGAGRDFMFAGAGQFDFTVFPYLARAMVGLLGLAAASMSLSLAGLALWFVALVVLCRRLAGGYGFVMAVAAVILLPGGYDGVGAFHIGEAQATPRIFAEAFSIFALAALLAGRPAATFGLLAVAFCFHPLMALGAAGAVVIYLCLGDRRWLWLVGAGAVALAAAVWLRLPLAERLLVQVPAPWRAVIWDRSENILVSHWQAGFWCGLAVQAVTIVIAALRARGRVGRLLWAALATGLAGLAAAWLLGDGAALVLVLQMQVWRAVWVTTLAAGLALALIAMGRDGEGERGLGLPLLVLAWMCVDMPPVCLALLAAGATVWMLEGRGRLLPRPLLANGLWGLALAIALARAVLTAMACLAVAAGRPAGAAAPYQAWEALIDALAIIVLIALIVAARWRQRRPPPRWALAAAVLVLALGALLWDARSPAQRQAERPATAPALRQLVASRPGEVLWVEGDAEPWIWLGRPSWVSSMHGAGAVFSPQLAATWNERTLRAMRAGLFSPEGRTPFRTTRPVALRPSLAQVRTFCAAPDAPAWIVMPDLAPDSPLRRLAAMRWRPPVATFQPSFVGRVLSWRGGRDFSALACRGAPLG